MGQKVNPISLRLHPENKHFDSCWFSEKQYADSMHKSFSMETYQNAILKQIQYPSASFLFEGAPRKCKVSVLFLNPQELRKNAFRQFGNSNSRNKRAKQNTLFSAKKETTPLYGLPEKESGSLALLPSLPSYFFTPAFLQTLKNPDRSSSSFLPRKKEREKTRQRGVAHFARKMYRQHPYLQSKKSVCSSLLTLSISRYFIEKTRSENLLSATFRFLLLQAFFFFLKKNENREERLHLQSQNRREDVFFPKKKQDNHNSGLVQAGNTLLLKTPVKVPGPLFLEEKRKTPLFNPFSVFDGVKNKAVKNKEVKNNRFTNPGGQEENQLFPSLKKSSIYTYHIESVISDRLRTSCRTFFFKAQNVAQSALFVAEEIAYQLQRRNSFRQIKTKFLQELGSKPGIKGVRVTCVGRIGGRAKKAQRARGESFKLGQTSLHLFDSRVSFASKTAFTPFGAVGVKVWVCWR